MQTDIWMWVALICLVLLLVTPRRIQESFWLLPWSISTRNPRMSSDLRGDPNLIYRMYPDGGIYPDGYVYAPYFYTSHGRRRRIPHAGFYIR
jgi:hypothetical protein